MSKHKLSPDEIKEIAHFIARRSIKAATGQPVTALTEYLETYNTLIDEMEEYNKKLN